MQQYMYCLAPAGLTLSTSESSLFLQSPTSDLHNSLGLTVPSLSGSISSVPPAIDNFSAPSVHLGLPPSQLTAAHLSHPLPAPQGSSSPAFHHSIQGVAPVAPAPQSLVQQQQIQLALVPAEPIYIHTGTKVRLEHQQPDQQPQQFAMVCKPSRVVHLRGIPSDTAEFEVIQLGLPFGHMTNIVLAKKKNQALLEMFDLQSAQSMVSYYNERPAQIRGRSVYVQFSNHDQLKTDPSLNGMNSFQIIRDSNSCSSSTPQIALNSPAQQQLIENGERRNVLRVIIENLLYPVTIDIIKQIFSRYGQVQKIVTFNKNNSFQALIQYSEAASAHTAKMALNGQNIYHGCCQLRIDFSKLPTLNVRYNNEKSRDYTDSGLPAGDFPPSTLTFTGQPIAYAQHSGVLTPAYATVIPGFGSATLAYCTTASGTGGTFPYAGQGVIPAVQLATTTGVRLTSAPAAQHAVTPLTSVLLVTNLNEEKVTPDTLFVLFGVYGDVMRVKIMYNKKDNALVQYADPNQAQIGLMHLDKIRLWDKPIKVTLSKHTLVQMPKEGQPDAGLTKDYTNSTLHRFKKLYSKNYNNIYAPSATLHLSNIPPTTTKEQLVDLFTQSGNVVAFKFFETDHKMALMQMSSIDEAVICLIEFHNYQLAETAHLRVSFSKSTIGSTVRGGVRESEEEENDEGTSENEDIHDHELLQENDDDV